MTGQVALLMRAPRHTLQRTLQPVWHAPGLYSIASGLTSSSMACSCLPLKSVVHQARLAQGRHTGQSSEPEGGGGLVGALPLCASGAGGQLRPELLAHAQARAPACQGKSQLPTCTHTALPAPACLLRFRPFRCSGARAPSIAWFCALWWHARACTQAARLSG